MMDYSKVFFGCFAEDKIYFIPNWSDRFIGEKVRIGALASTQNIRFEVSSDKFKQNFPQIRTMSFEFTSHPIFSQSTN